MQTLFASCAKDAWMNPPVRFSLMSEAMGGAQVLTTLGGEPNPEGWSSLAYTWSVPEHEPGPTCVNVTPHGAYSVSTTVPFATVFPAVSVSKLIVMVWPAAVAVPPTAARIKAAILVTRMFASLSDQQIFACRNSRGTTRGLVTRRDHVIRWWSAVGRSGPPPHGLSPVS